MQKKSAIIAILLASFLFFSAYSYADSCCLSSTFFCQDNIPLSACCGSDQDCISSNFLSSVSCSQSGLCISPPSSETCCLDSCQPATFSGYSSPYACNDPSSYAGQACSAFSECSVGCAYCQVSTGTFGWMSTKMTLKEAVETCSPVQFFNTTADSCTGLAVPSISTYSVSGKVSSTDGSPISGATVSVAGISATTNSVGDYQIAAVPSGTFSARAFQDNFYEATTPVVVDSDRTVNFALSPIETANLHVTVDTFSGTPAAGASVSAAGQQKTADSAGTAVFTLLPQYNPNHVKRYYFILAALGEASNSTNIALADVASVTLTLPTTAVGAINGTITNELGDAVQGTTISAAGKTAITDADGFYSIQGIPVGQYEITIAPPEPYGIAQDSISVEEGITNVYDFQVQGVSQETFTLTVSVTDENDDALPNAQVTIRQIGVAVGTTYNTASGGTIAVQLTKSIPYVISVSKTGYTSSEETKSFTEDSTENFQLQQLAGYSIRGKVTSANGTPLEGAAVYLEGFADIFSSVTTESGIYSISGVPAPSSYLLTAFKAGYRKNTLSVAVLTNDVENNITLFTEECYIQTAPPEITSLGIEGNKTVISFESTCPLKGYYVYRCEGQGCSDMEPITNILPSSATSFADGTIEPAKYYTYEIHAYFEKPFVKEVASSPMSIYTGAKECYNLQTDEFCYNDTRSRCDENNSIVMIAAGDETKYCKQTGETTAYVLRIDCAVECNSPLGMFSIIGNFSLLLEGGQMQKIACSDIPVVSEFSQLAYCYKDYAKTVVSRYYSCSNVSSCYDYLSQDACGQNYCGLGAPEGCEWRPYSDDLSLGVCAPKNPAYWDCNRCNQYDKFNNLFGTCNDRICDLYGGDSASHYCYFSEGTCGSKDLKSCASYGNSRERCANTANVSVDINPVNGKNTITQESDDLLEFGLCRFGTDKAVTYSDSCFKDADNNQKPDRNQSDMSVPFTVAIHPTATNSIEFPVIVYDDSDKKEIMNDAETFFQVTDTPGAYKRPDLPADGGIISLSGLTKNNQNYTVWFYSRDDADNLEVVKNFSVYIDFTAPPVDFRYSYDTANSQLSATINTTEVINCTAVLYDDNGNAIPGENPLQGEVGLQFSNIYNVLDGVYSFRYECSDWVGNNISDEKLIVIDTENMIYDGQPNTTMRKQQVSSISVRTRADAFCKYVDVPMKPDGSAFEFDSLAGIDFTTGMVPFEQTNSKFHSSSVSIPEDSIAKMYLVKCQLKDTGNLTRSNISGIRFTVDSVPPEIKIYEAGPRAVRKEYNLSRWRNAANIIVSCIDPAAPPVHPIKEFGCNQLKYCLSLGSECEPQPFEIDSDEGTANGTEIQLSLDQTESICYNAVDKGGNAGENNCVRIKVDRSAPKVTLTPVGASIRCIADSGFRICRVKGSEIAVEGSVQNVSYWSDIGGFLPAYFSNFELNATVNASDFAEILFDYSGPNFFDYVQFNFDDDQMIYGKSAQATPGIVQLVEEPPINVTVSANGPNAEIRINGVPYVSFERIAGEGYMNLSRNSSFSNVVVADASSTSGLKENLSVLVNGVKQSKQIALSGGSFSSTINISSLLAISPQQGALSIQATDEAGNVGEDSIYAVIDNMGPIEPPQFDPPIGDDVNSFGENYDLLGYPMHYESGDSGSEGIYYIGAQGDMIYFTGYTSEPGVRIEAWINGTFKIAEYQQPLNESYSQLASPLAASENVPSGATTVYVGGDQTGTVNSIGSDKYASFENHHRTEYGHYGEAYKITDVQFIESKGTALTLDAPLEKSISQGEEILISSMARKADRFNLSIETGGAEYGTAWTQLVQYDDLGNLGAPTNVINLVFDGVAPENGSIFPSVNFGAVKKINNITMEIIERGSGIREDNINLTINGARVPLSDITLRRESYDVTETEGMIARYTLFYNFAADQDGNYLIKLRVTDKANNPLDHTWNLTVDSRQPRTPEFTVTNGVLIGTDPDGWNFVSGIPQVTASYVDPEQLSAIINISDVRLVVPEGTGTATCARIGNYDRFDCTLGIAQFEDGDYLLKISPIKIFSDGTYISRPPLQPYDIFRFVRDTEVPQVENFTIRNSFMRSDAGINYSVTVPNENHNVIIAISLTDEDGEVFNLESTNIKLTPQNILGQVSPETMQKEIILNGLDLSDGQTYSVRINVSDYGKNYNDAQMAAITIDETPPELSPSDIIINAIPIYQYTLPSAGGEEDVRYIVQKDIVNISGTVPNDVAELSFYRVTGDATRTLIGTLTPCKTSSAGACVNNITGQFYFPATNTTVVGKLGEVITNKIEITAKDRAGNTGETSKLIYSDLESPIIIICISPTECSQEVPQEYIPQSIDEVVSICGYDPNFLTCYNRHISAMCSDQDTGYIDYSCYINNLASAGGITKDVRLAELCADAYVPGYTKPCVFGFVAASGATDLCDTFKGSPQDYDSCISGAG